MLVPSRKAGEVIHIGGGIVVTVVSVREGRVRVGIDAPRDVPVLRDELVPPEADAPGAKS
jgi:carbon storage regulator